MRQNDYLPRSRYRTDPVGGAFPVKASRDRRTKTRALMLALIDKARQFIYVLQRDRSAKLFILMVLSANVLLIFLHVIAKFIGYFDVYRDTLFYPGLLLTAEGGYPEIFNYLQLAVLVWLMFRVFVRTRQAIYASLALVFLLTLAEDALQLHERIGGYAARADLPSPSFLSAQHLGEALHFLVIGALSIAVLIYGWVASSAEDRRIGGIFVLWFFVLGWFAAVVDVVHDVVQGKIVGAGFILGIVEDGGEMVTVALALSTAVLLFRHLDDLRRPFAPKYPQ